MSGECYVSGLTILQQNIWVQHHELVENWTLYEDNTRTQVVIFILQYLSNCKNIIMPLFLTVYNPNFTVDFS